MKFIPRSLSIIASMLIASAPCAAQTPEQWFEQGKAAVEAARRLKPIDRPAKNIILFVGDGMSLTTVTAARILEGQMRGQPGEENLLSFEKLPYVALMKTYNTNQQTPDSAGTMSAMMTGVKTKAGVISVNQNVVRGRYETTQGHEVTTFLERCEQRGMATGVVTTTTVTNATPAACYAHSPERNWENDSHLPADARAAGFLDIARQLIEFPYGNGLEVVLGGGRNHFFPKTVSDPEDPQQMGGRLDGRNLVAEWTRRPRAAYVWDQAGFDALDASSVDRLLGLFAPTTMAYEHDRPGDTAGEPSLSEMTAKAIDILARNSKGFFLMVEGGRIDHAHHACNAYRALTDTVEFAKAVSVALAKVTLQDTLVIVTADHSHVFTMGGYPTRGHPILGKVKSNDVHGEPAAGYYLDALGLPYTTLLYANGPGYTGASAQQPEGPKVLPHWVKECEGISAGRPDLTKRITQHPNYLQEAALPLPNETHGGEDVPLYAGGPQAHLFHGVQEQNIIFHIMVCALGKDGNPAER